MLTDMETTQFIEITAGSRGIQGHDVSPDDELCALLKAQVLVCDLGRRVAAHTSSPVRAALFARAAEDAHRTAAHMQLLAADSVRHTLAHELPETTFDEIAAIHQNPTKYLSGNADLPPDPRTVPTGRLVFKDTTDFLTGFLHIGYYEARERVRAIDRLLPGTDIHGVHIPAQFPALAKDLADGAADPHEIGTAARKLEKLTPQISQLPDPGPARERLEGQVAESVRREDPRTTAKLLSGIQTTLDQGNKDIPEEVLRSRCGFFFRGVIGGLGEFLLRTRPSDTEAILAMFASTDNPRSKAGNRDGLLSQARGVSGHADTSDPTRVHSEAVTTEPNTTDSNSGTTTESSTTESSGFPDFLVEPSTGEPLTDPETIRNLSLDADGIGNLLNLFNDNGTNTTGTAAQLSALNATTYGVDGLTPPQRHLQGLLNLIRSAGTPSSGKKTIGMPSPKTLIIATLDELRGLAETNGITSRSQKLSAAELRQSLCNGSVIPMIMNGKSRILDLGREQRLFPDYMREAILSIYGGCIYPNCTVPPEHCEIDHFDEWEDGGSTEINSGGPFCGNHHHAKHAGLITVVRDEDGLYSVILPKFLDPEQKPRRNTYWRSRPQNPTLF
ncbi:HNH endonuclease [Arthrobacter sp. 7749]|nr:HNH endonuclease [Arthrobacter sp. 7749]